MSSNFMYTIPGLHLNINETPKTHKMNTRRNQLNSSLLLFFTIFITASCTAQGVIPDKWTPEMRFKYTYGGGMTDYSKTIELRETGSYILVRTQGKEIKANLQLTIDQLNDFLKFLVKNNFGKMKSEPREGVVYDMGTTEYLLSWKGGAHGVSHGASTEISEKYRNHFSAIGNYLNKFGSGSPVE